MNKVSSPPTALLAREAATPSPSIEHPLPSGRVVEIALEEETVRIYGTGGNVEVTVTCTPAGCVLRFETANLSLQNRGKIEVVCEELTFDAKRKLDLRTEGDLTTKVAGNSTTEVTGKLEARADEVHFKATSGDAVLEANDFVRLKGEEILLNSEDDPRERQRQLLELWKALNL